MYGLIRLVTLLALSTTSIATCYFPNGDESPSDTACNPSSIESPCCFDGQACLSNGLCVSDPHSASLARLHRGTCTDQAWKSGNCPRECLDIDNNGVPVYSCNATNSDTYCCFDNCECDSRWEVFTGATSPADVYTVTIIGEDFTQTHSSAASTAFSSTATIASGPSTSRASTGSITVTSTSTSPASEKSSSNSGTAIGVGVGVGVGGAALIGAAAFFFYRRRRNARARNIGPHEVAADSYYHPHSSQTELKQYAHYANSGNYTSPGSSELPAQSFDPVELPASPQAKPSSAQQQMKI